MSDSADEWLAREVTDLLEAGSVGLYELIWLLNGSEYDLDESSKLKVALRVVERMVHDGQAQLYEVTWPNNDVVGGPMVLSALPSEIGSWATNPGERYLALVAEDES